MLFTRIDRNLLVRVVQELREQAEVVRRSHSPWTAAPESVLEKRRHDRLLRDAKDLELLRGRMQAQFPDMKVMPLVAKAPESPQP